ncbi:hypothetical protein IJ707_04135 [bacterium]|nr:hypothetical protein [bacterium]
MKIKFVFLVIIILMISTIVPAVAENGDGSDYASLYHLNKLVRTNNLKEKLLFAEYDRYMIKQSENNHEPETMAYCLNCMCRNERVLKDFKYTYFLPSYEVYKSFDEYSDLSYEDWKYTIGLSSQSAIKDYYQIIKQNYIDCKRIYFMNK